MKNKPTPLILELEALYTEYQRTHPTSGGYYGKATLEQFIFWLRTQYKFEKYGDK
jgi:hypothetical protein